MSEFSIKKVTQANDPAKGAISITPADVDLTYPIRALYVGTAGDVIVEMLTGDVVTFVGVAASTVLPIAPKQVRTGTTALNIVGLY